MLIVLASELNFNKCISKVGMVARRYSRV